MNSTAARSLSPPSPTAGITRRRVHYFSGFDPRGAAHYYRLHREQAGKPQPTGCQVQLGPRRKHGEQHTWQVRWSAPGATHPVPPVDTEHVFMGWDDIVRAHWSRSPWALAQEFAAVLAAMWRDTSLRQLHRLHATTVLTAVLPTVYVVLALLLAGLLGLSSHRLPMPGLLASAFAWGNAVLLLYGALLLGDRLGLFWLVRIYHFVLRLSQAQVSALSQRQQQWVEDIVQQQQRDPVDEVVLAGHSVGTLVMVEVVDALLQDSRWQALQSGRPTALLTLGQCYPSLTLLTGAEAFRQALFRLTRHPQLAWLDVTALIDPLCCYRTAPLQGTALSEAAPAPQSPVLLAARFFQMYEPAHWARLRRDKLQAHFLYLMTPDKPGNFDFFTTLYGPQPFEATVAQAGQPAADHSLATAAGA